MGLKENNTINVCHISTLTRWGGVESRLVEYLSNRDDKKLRHFVVATSAIDEIVEEISLDETRLFVKLVMNNYAEYVTYYSNQSNKTQ